MPELRECPFCGGEAERIDFGPGSGDNEGGSCVACTRCQASGPVEFGYKENFVSNWNRRNGEQCRAASGLTADMAKALPGGKLDDSTFQSIEEALDAAEAPMRGTDGKWLTLSERIRALSRGVPEGMVLNAARYDWLRDSASRIEWNGCYTYSPGYTAHDADLMDQAIDAAIAAQRKEG